MGRKRPTPTETSEDDSTTADRRRPPVDRSGPGSTSAASDPRVPPAKGHGPDRGGPRVPGIDPTGRGPGDPTPGPPGFRDGARALASRISDGVPADDASTDDAGSVGRSADGGVHPGVERGAADDRDGPTDGGERDGPTDGDEDDAAGLKERLQETFPELDVGKEDLRDVQWRNVVKKIALAETRNAPGVRGAVAGASELHQQLSKGDPLDGRVADIHDRLGEFPPPEGWAESIADRAALAVVARIGGRNTPTFPGAGGKP